MVEQIQGSHTVSGSNPLYKFKAIAPLTDRISQSAIAIPFISTSPANTLLFRFSGQLEEYKFTFYIYNDGVDASGGTCPTNSDFPNGTVKTVTEQIVWLKDYVFDNDFDTIWTFTQTRYDNSGVNGVITELSFNNDGGRVSTVPVSMTFKVGRATSF